MRRIGSRAPWRVILAVGLLWATAALAPGTAGASGREAVEHGRDQFRIYCANCHGPEGRGDGPTASGLPVRPADLTLLSRKNRGEFPLQEAWSAIDGRDDLPAHGSRSMPIWGLAFQEPGTDVGQENEVHTRIEWLIEFLKSIQRPLQVEATEPDP